ncbi:MAG: hypothetical protein KF830_14235 [Planctomycetes bacterium]|nr:hypothetical protein [Planctomycetota bacterium]
MVPRLCRWLAWTPLAACALSAPPAEQTLAPMDANPTPAAELDALAAAALAAARAAPDDAEAQLTAAARLFEAADLRLQQATVAWLDAHPDADRATVLAAEDRLGADVRAAIVSLCTDGLACAERAAVLRPDAVAAPLHVGLHLSLLAWANGPARSLFAGYGGRLVAAIDRALALDAAFDHGAPLRLQGRFRSKAPWPYADLPAAVQALARAVQLAPLPVSLLFHGDALAAAGDAPGAEVQWRRAAAAPADASTRWSAECMRELARRRLAAQP